MANLANDPGCRVAVKMMGDVVIETCDKPIVARVEMGEHTGVGLCKRHKQEYYEWKKSQSD